MVNYAVRVPSVTSVAAPGRRLAREARRLQLLDLAVGIVSDVGLDKLSAETVSRAAGVSKALVFHYFPSNRDLQVAVVREAAQNLLASLDVDPSKTPDERLRAGVDAFIDFIEADPTTYQSVARGAGSDPALLEVFEETRHGVVALIAAAIGLREGELPPGLRLAVRSWIALVEESVLHWLDGEPVPRAELVEFLHRAAQHLFADPFALKGIAILNPD